ncbi:MAG: potassium transporter Kup [Planctomycetota bacterium]
MSHARAQHLSTKALAGLAIGAVGVVFGDIGTSPLYALKESFAHLKHLGQAMDETYVRGLLSLVFWLVVFVVNVKYIFLITRASNRGEGGIFALLSLIPRGLSAKSRRGRFILSMLAIAGAGLLFGDGIITPSISVLSAMEGLKVANPVLEPAIIPATIAILVGLFYFQQFGTARIGVIFGPIMVVWFSVLAILGVFGIMKQPDVIGAVNPMYAIEMIRLHPFEVFVLLGSIVLCVTGAEALYADMGHFGIKPIRLGWYLLVGPALILNYFGQGAVLLSAPPPQGSEFNPFYALVPEALVIPMVVLATCATIIASQAMISGVFSIARQAIRLNQLPRLEVVHTSTEQEGQIYLPSLNGLMLVGCLITVLLFPSSSELAGAYGIAVTLDMAITTLLFAVVARRFWRWRRRWVMLLIGLFLVVDVVLVSANMLKLASGGWFALLIALMAFIVMSTWVQGSFHIGKKLAEDAQSIHEFLATLWTDAIPRVPGTAVFLTTNYNTPLALKHFVEHAHVLHQQVVLVTIVSSNLPVVPPARQVRVEWLPDGVWKITALCGFMESPNIPRFLERAKAHGFDFDPEQTTYFARRTSVVPTGTSKMAGWRKRLYSALSRNSVDATRSFNLPPDRVVDFGAQVEL